MTNLPDCEFQMPGRGSMTNHMYPPIVLTESLGVDFHLGEQLTPIAFNYVA